MSGSYRYRAATAEGKVVEGVVQVGSQQAALEELQRQRLYPIDIAPEGPARAARERRALGRGPALALFARTMATLMGAGVPVDRALAFAAGQARHPALAAAARRALDALQSGESLAGAMANEPAAFGPVVVAMAAAGEESGALDECMARLADHLDTQVELRSQVRASLIYPALMAFASGVGTIILLMFVVPRFVTMLDEAEAALPLSTRLLAGASRIVADGWWLLLILAAVALLGARAWLARPENRRRFHANRLSWPIGGELESKLITARFTRALGMLLRSGRPLLPSIRVARSAVTNLAMAAGIDRAADSVSHGHALNSALAGTLPALATELIAVGEESGRLDELCLRVADTYDVEVRRTLRSLVAVIEPAMILLFALLVGFIALAMLQAIYGLNTSLL
jgi:type II secretory pathway component PulF